MIGELAGHRTMEADGGQWGKWIPDNGIQWRPMEADKGQWIPDNGGRCTMGKMWESGGLLQ